MHRIKALVMDVDGTLTDGGIYIGNSGELMKCFYVRDGHAIKHFLPKMGIVPIIITGRQSDIVIERCREIGIDHVIQGSSNKWDDLRTLLSSLDIRPEETAYIGDDVNDLNCMEHVGVCGCPADAVKEITMISNYVTVSSGGRGAVREFIEWLGESNEKDFGAERNNQ